MLLASHWQGSQARWHAWHAGTPAKGCGALIQVHGPFIFGAPGQLTATGHLGLTSGGGGVFYRSPLSPFPLSCDPFLPFAVETEINCLVGIPSPHQSRIESTDWQSSLWLQFATSSSPSSINLSSSTHSFPSFSFPPPLWLDETFPRHPRNRLHGLVVHFAPASQTLSQPI